MENLIDPEDGENRAVRMFLALYGAAHGITLGGMKKHMTHCGFPHWPAWVGEQSEGAHLTKGGAQLWLRYLISLELTDERIDALVREQCPGFDDAHEGPDLDDIRAIVRAAIAA